MANRATITSIIVNYVQNGEPKRKKILPTNADGSMKFTALFWDESSIVKILAPYYEKNKVPLKPELMSKLEKYGRSEQMGGDLQPQDAMMLWNGEEEGELPLMIAKELASPMVDVR